MCQVMKSRLLYSWNLMLVHQVHQSHFFFSSEMLKFCVSSLTSYWQTLYLSSWISLSNSFILIFLQFCPAPNISPLPRKISWAFRVPLAPPYRSLVPHPVLAWARGWVRGWAPEVGPPSRPAGTTRQGWEVIIFLQVKWIDVNTKYGSIWRCPKMGIPQNHSFQMLSILKWSNVRFGSTPILGNLHMTLWASFCTHLCGFLSLFWGPLSGTQWV